MKKIYLYISLVAITLFVASSCSNFEELNTNPNKTTKVTSGMLATQTLKDTYKFWATGAYDFAVASLWCKYTAFVRDVSTPEQYYAYGWAYGSVNYKQLTDLKRMVELSEGSKFEPSYRGLALYLKAISGFSKTTSLGDVPYSEAGKAEEGITMPKYDKQSDVFVQVLEDLKAAEMLFAQGVNFDGDIMYGGDAKKWQKLCNATQLKVLQTLSKKITVEQKKRFAEIVASGNLMTSNADILQLPYSETTIVYPYWNGETTREYNAPTNLVVDELKRLKDRRLFIFAEPAEALIKAGKLETDYEAYEGAPPQLPAKTLHANNKAGMYSLMNKRYVEFKAGDPKLNFTYAEQCFIIAEAIEEGWVNGNAKEYYENGVKATLSYYKNLPSAANRNHGMPITQEYIDNYFTGAAAYASGGTKTDRLKQIWMQRWLIRFFQGTADYTEFLRTGYPVFPLDPTTSQNSSNPTGYPQRMMYPTKEQTTNPVNYQKAIDEQYGGFDDTNKTLWFLQ